jgi:hypothetical protein
MYVLEDKRDGAVNVIECVCNSQYELIGDYNSDKEWEIDIERAMFCLEHDDPYLEVLSLGSTTTIGGDSKMLRVFDAILKHSTIKSLNLVWDDVDSLLWTCGESRETPSASHIADAKHVDRQHQCRNFAL